MLNGGDKTFQTQVYIVSHWIPKSHKTTANDNNTHLKL